MKRVLSFVLILALIVPVLLVPVLAAEVYEFYHAPVVLPEFDRVEGSPTFLCESEINSGMYILSLIDNGIILSSEPFRVELSLVEDNGVLGFVSYFDISFGDSAIFPASVLVRPGMGSMIAFLNPSGGVSDLFPSADYFILTSVSPSLGEIITGDMLLEALAQLVALLPVVLGVIVLSLGIRKGIGFLMALVRGS